MNINIYKIPECTFRLECTFCSGWCIYRLQKGVLAHLPNDSMVESSWIFSTFTGCLGLMNLSSGMTTGTWLSSLLCWSLSSKASPSSPGRWQNTTECRTTKADKTGYLDKCWICFLKFDKSKRYVFCRRLAVRVFDCIIVDLEGRYKIIEYIWGTYPSPYSIGLTWLSNINH